MAKSEKKKPGKKKPKASAAPPPAQVPAKPPPDNPLLRGEATGQPPASRELAEKRLAALRRARQMYSSDDAPPGE